jgi:hypothetical protein
VWREHIDSDIAARERTIEQGTGHEEGLGLDLISDKMSGELDDECPACFLVVFSCIMMNYNKLCP